jgi:hypothetical protein
MRGRGVFIASLAFIGAAACTSDGEHALALMREACRSVPTVPGTDAAVPDAVANRDQYVKAADAAAKAVRLDSRWNDAARAYSTIADAWTFRVTLPTGTASGRVDVDTLSAEQQTTLRRIASEATSAEETVRAECRKVG